MHNEITVENTLYVGLGVYIYIYIYHIMFFRGEKTMFAYSIRNKKKC